MLLLLLHQQHCGCRAIVLLLPLDVAAWHHQVTFLSHCRAYRAMFCCFANRFDAVSLARHRHRSIVFTQVSICSCCCCSCCCCCCCCAVVAVAHGTQWVLHIDGAMASPLLNVNNRRLQSTLLAMLLPWMGDRVLGIVDWVLGIRALVYPSADSLPSLIPTN